MCRKWWQVAIAAIRLKRRRSSTAAVERVACLDNRSSALGRLTAVLRLAVQSDRVAASLSRLLVPFGAPKQAPVRLQGSDGTQYTSQQIFP